MVGLSLGLTVVAASLVGVRSAADAEGVRPRPGDGLRAAAGTTMDVLSLAIYLVIGRLLLI